LGVFVWGAGEQNVGCPRGLPAVPVLGGWVGQGGWVGGGVAGVGVGEI
jgi:hypothetical protein